MKAIKSFFLQFKPSVLFFVFFLSLTIFSGCSEEPASEIVKFTAVDPLEKIFKETAFFKEADSVAYVAAGEHATFQFAVRGQENIKDLKMTASPLVMENDSLNDLKVGYIGYVRIGRNNPAPSRDKLNPISGFYPDPIFDKESVDISANETQPVWLTINIPVVTNPGIYSGWVTLTGKIENRPFHLKKAIAVKVYPVKVEKTSLWVTNWYSASPHNLELIFGEKNIQPYSEKYWEYINMLAAKMAEYDQNVALISPLSLSGYKTDDKGHYSIDFTNFDKTVEIFQKQGVIGRIEGGHIGGREGGWISKFVVSVPVVEQDSTIFKNMKITNDTARNFYSTFIPALVSHLKEKGWYAIYLQHLMDEPIPENVDSYIQIAKFIRNLAPDIKFVEACHSKDVDGMVNVWVPQLDFMDLDYSFYHERQARGDEIWFYTCLNPKGEYANRFIELPLLKTRILHWINFRYDIPGYLHWGFNFWNQNPYDETTSIQTEGGTILIGGDAWITYPAKGRILSSIRLEAMRDGIVDYELLKMLRQKDSTSAKEIADQVVYRFNYYDMDIAAFREKRHRILELLSQ
jgi:hypothetical protein